MSFSGASNPDDLPGEPDWNEPANPFMDAILNGEGEWLADDDPRLIAATKVAEQILANKAEHGGHTLNRDPDVTELSNPATPEGERRANRRPPHGALPRGYDETQRNRRP